METAEWLPIVLNILATVGGSSLVAALLPLKVRKYWPIVAKLLDVIAANVGTAQNKDPETIEIDRQIKKARLDRIKK